MAMLLVLLLPASLVGLTVWTFRVRRRLQVGPLGIGLTVLVLFAWLEVRVGGRGAQGA